MLHYSLYENTFSEDDPDDCLARPVDVAVHSIDDLIEAITGPGSILKPTETKAVIDNYWSTIASYIRQGKAYRDEYISTRFSIRGVFESEEDRFDPARHQVQVNVVIKDSITDAVSDIDLQIVDERDITPEIETVYDWGSGTNDEILTPGNVLEITGDYMKIQHNLEEEGVFFVSQDSNTEVKAEQIRDNEPKTLTLRIPESLEAGPWRIEVRNTRYENDQLSTGLFEPVLTVE
ncbi:DUF4469 domain-containing protein [Aliifodinibius sp. S!AR15-10]|uniref:DNA-binding domain-containing protein n=1 Tax=Aliifodinibius sp. S!AR15-10 TaxID=2950437 RepID=UPI00285E0E72|nr:DNA-binding domain-containing protein [Aliifodinibius sp. S!AR15-10]MDR8393892.1 DUF4469 domain-containing protein [Aliifodinibius sp. S!AR15-10]